jgi:hypothetical protein
MRISLVVGSERGPVPLEKEDITCVLDRWTRCVGYIHEKPARWGSEGEG